MYKSKTKKTVTRKYFSRKKTGSIGPSRRTTSKSYRRRKSGGITKHIKLSIFAFIAILFAASILVVVMAFNFLHAPFTRASDSIYFKDSVWDENKPFINIAVVKLDQETVDGKIEKLALFNIDDHSNKYTIYDFPTHEPLKLVSNGSNKERDVTLEDLYSFSNYNRIDFTTSLRDFFVNHLAVKIDGYIIVDQDGYNDIVKSFGDVDYNDIAVNFRLKNTFKIPGAIFEFRSKAKTNLSMNDVLSLIQFIKNTPDDGNRIYEVSKYELLDLDKWDILWQSGLQISDIKKEGIKVFVLNASDPKIPGLASWGTRISKNIGTGMFGSDNSFTDFERNTIIAEDENLSTVKTLKEIFPEADFQQMSDLPVTGAYNPEIFRTKVTLVLVNY